MDWTTGVQYPAGGNEGIFSLLHCLPGSGVHPASCPIGTGASLPRR